MDHGLRARRFRGRGRLCPRRYPGLRAIAGCCDGGGVRCLDRLTNHSATFANVRNDGGFVSPRWRSRQGGRDGRPAGGTLAPLAAAASAECVRAPATGGCACAVRRSPNNPEPVMTTQITTQVTKLLQSLQQGDGDAMQVVIPLVYEELRKLARAHLRREGSAARLHTTTLVHEAFLRLSAGSHPSYENRAHFYGIASRVMRQVLVDSARARSARKRGAGIEVAMASLP